MVVTTLFSPTSIEHFKDEETSSTSDKAPKSKVSSCHLTDKATESSRKIFDKISQRITAYQSHLVSTGDDIHQSLTDLKKETLKTIEQKKEETANSYLNLPWRSSRPDITLLIEIFLAVMFLVILYKVLPYLRGSAMPPFTRDQFIKATKLAPSAFSVEEIAKVDLEVKAFQDYADYFHKDPFSPENSGVNDLMVANAVLPIFLILVQYVIPPFVISYIVWFIVRFWPYVMKAAWGFYLAMYGYFTTLIQGKLGCKWYIRAVTGWHCRSPNFYTYFNDWRRNYIDRPIYVERLKYVRRFYNVRRQYYDIPYRQYITLPLSRYKVKAKFAKKIYLDRAVDVFLRKLQNLYPEYYELPRDEFYQWILGKDQNLATLYSKVSRTKKQMSGDSYISVTPSGKECKCPATTTPVSVIKDTVQKGRETLGQELDRLIAMTDQVYDKISQMEGLGAPDCNTVDKVITHRKSIMRSVVLLILASAVGLMVYSYYFGTPLWLLHVLTPMSRYIYQGTRVVLSGRGYSAWVIFYGTLITTLLGLAYW